MNVPGVKNPLVHKANIEVDHPQISLFDAKYNIPFTRYLDSDGRPLAPLPEFACSGRNLIPLYESMVFTRVFDKKAISLQRTGQLGTYASSLGQEAIGTAIGSCMHRDDVLVPAYREYAAQFLRGVTMTEILLYWGGNEQGMNFKHAPHDFPICVPIASQAPQAVGVAYAMKIRRQKRVTVCVLGDGATSKGDFYEAINAAGIWNLPIVFVINNNRWAISLPRQQQSAAKTLAQKAFAAGINGEQVDGNDVIAMQDRMLNAVERARNGHGVTLIEALSYRLCDHTTADDAGRYRSETELESHWQREPLIRLRNYLIESGVWSDTREKELLETAAQHVEAAVNDYLNTPPQPPESMFDYLFSTLPAALVRQRASITRQGSSND